MEVINYFKRCNECKREILVSIGLFGVNHNAGVLVVCKECLKKKGMNKRFKEQNPKGAKELEEWLNKGGTKK